MNFKKLKESPIFEKLEQSRFYQFWRYYLAGLYQKIDTGHMFLYGGGLAYSLFLCIMPLILIIFSILGTVLEVASVERQLGILINQVIPYSRYAAFVQEVIASRVEEVIAYKRLAGVLGVLGVVIAASGLFSNMRTILDAVYNIHTDTRFVLAKLKDIGMILVAVVCITLATTLLPIIEPILDSTQRVGFLHFLQITAIQKALVLLGSFLFIFVLFCALYYLIPNRRIGLRTAAVSAFWAAVLWELAKQLFGYYITNFATLSRIYGAYIFMVVVAFWIYYSSLVFILGAEIGQLYRQRPRA